MTTNQTNQAAKVLEAPFNLAAEKGGKKIITNDEKYNMYINALPVKIRQEVFERKLNPRALYMDYRKIGKEAFLAKYEAEKTAGAKKSA